MQLLTMIMHFHSAVTKSHGAIFTEISQWRWCYVTAAVDPAVHITKASHCGRVTCLIQATFRRQQQQHSSCYYSLASVTEDHAEPCSSHTEQPCSAPQLFSFYCGLSNSSIGSKASYKLILHYAAHLPSNVKLTHTRTGDTDALFDILLGHSFVMKATNIFCPQFQLCCKLSVYSIYIAQKVANCMTATLLQTLTIRVVRRSLIELMNFI